MLEDGTLLATIHQVDQEIMETKMEVAKLHEVIDDEVKSSPTHGALQEAKERVKALQAELKRDIQGSPIVNNALEEVAQYTLKLSDLKEILSHHLIRYHSEHDASQVPMSDGRARQLIMNARLGKEEYYQEKMPFGNKNVTVTRTENGKEELIYDSKRAAANDK